MADISGPLSGGIEEINGVKVKYIKIPKGTILFSYGKRSVFSNDSMNTFFTEYSSFFGTEYHTVQQDPMITGIDDAQITFNEEWQIFFFPFPFLGFGVTRALSTQYRFIGIYSTTKELKLFYLMGDDYNRLMAKSDPETEFSKNNVSRTCTRKTYDPCFNIELSIDSNYDYSGYITVAKGESFYNSTDRYVFGMSNNIKQNVPEEMWQRLLLNIAYTSDLTIGYPEIVLRPLKNEIMREAQSISDSNNQRIYKIDRLTYLNFIREPISMMEGYYNFKLIDKIYITPYVRGQDKSSAMNISQTMNRILYDKVAYSLIKHVYGIDQATGFMLNVFDVDTKSSVHSRISYDYSIGATARRLCKKINPLMVIDYICVLTLGSTMVINVVQREMIFRTIFMIMYGQEKGPEEMDKLIKLVSESEEPEEPESNEPENMIRGGDGLIKLYKHYKNNYKTLKNLQMSDN